MGRQSARLWHDGKDYKDFWKLIEDEEDYLNMSWRMHWQIYKGNKLLWEKLPPNFLLFGSRKNKNGIFAYESVTGKKFTCLGFLKSYTEFNPGNIMRVCKVGKYVFAALYNKIIYTENCYSWKELNIDSLNLSNNNYMVGIENYNGRLLIYSQYKLTIYDCENKTFKDIYTSTKSLELRSTYNQFDNKIACIGDIAVVRAESEQSETRQYGFLVFKDDELVKKFFGEHGVRSFVAKGNNDTFVAYATREVFSYTDGLRPSIFTSKDGMIWNVLVDDPEYLVDLIFSYHDELYFGARDNIGKIKNGNMYEIENAVGADLYHSSIAEGTFLIITDDYIYCNNSNGIFIRFQDFEIEDYEILDEDTKAAGTYMNWEE